MPLKMYGVSPDEKWTFSPDPRYGLDRIPLRLGLYQVQVEGGEVKVLRAGADEWTGVYPEGAKIDGLSLSDLSNCGVGGDIWRNLFDLHGEGYFEKINGGEKQPKFPGVVLNSILMGQTGHLVPDYRLSRQEAGGWTQEVPCLKIGSKQQGTVFNVKCKRYLEGKKNERYMLDLSDDEKKKAVEVADGVKIVYRWSIAASCPSWVGWHELQSGVGGGEKENLLKAIEFASFMPALYQDIADVWLKDKTENWKQEETNKLKEKEAKRLKKEEAKRLKEEAKRLKREAKRLKKEAKRLKKKEAKRLKREAKRLKEVSLRF